jgi:two-component system, NtrC family, sensor kinase
MNIVNLITFFLVFYFKKPRKGEMPPIKWYSILNIIATISMILVVANSIFADDYKVWISIVSILPVSYLSYLVLTKPEFESKKQVLHAWLPIIVIESVKTLVQLIFPEFYSKRADYFEIGGVFAFIWAIAMWINNVRQAKKVEKERLLAIERERELKIAAKLKAELEVQVNQRTAELQSQKEELQLALDNLKSAQDQLIHAEKMASLGELTAGIAHEIQNPLNFVNNFSEVSNELIAELVEERGKEPALRDEGLVEELLKDIKDNLSKINFHGKRADGIVKGMLQHSRSSSGVKEPTDINELLDEYLRLAYHGLRAKDKSFNADFKANLEEGLPKINMISQDIGRVFLNLINNAFYAVNQKELEIRKSGDQKISFKPTVEVSSRKSGDKIVISVKDNGMGMSEATKQKIFQPFFTTKPTGQGTGLGMSLSYDIIKSHGGEINVNSEQGKGTEINIELPA